MRVMVKVLLLAVVALPIPAHADTLAQIRPQITAANNRFGPAIVRGDAGTIAADYLADGVLIPPKGAPVRGRAAIAQYYAQRMSRLARLTPIHCATQRLAFDGSAVLEEGACTFRGHRSAHFLTVWKKDADGRWRIAVNE